MLVYLRNTGRIDPEKNSFGLNMASLKMRSLDQSLNWESLKASMIFFFAGPGKYLHQ